MKEVSAERPVIELGEDESTSNRLTRKSKDNPFMAVGLVGCTFACIYGVYRFRNRGKLSASNYLMQLRVAAQGTVIGCLTIGVVYSMYQKFKPTSEDENKT